MGQEVVASVSNSHVQQTGPRIAVKAATTQLQKNFEEHLALRGYDFALSRVFATIRNSQFGNFPSKAAKAKA